MNRFRILIIFCFTIIFVSSNLNAQVFKGFSAFSAIIEYEGQRYLMDEIYDLKIEGLSKLKIDKTIKEVDSDEGFMFVLTSYKFNDKSGVVITSFNSTSFSNTKHQFVNVHLTNAEYDKLNKSFEKLEKYNLEYGEHILMKFNNRLILDVNNYANVIYYTLWVDNYSRHTFTPSKWDRANKKYKKFIE